MVDQFASFFLVRGLFQLTDAGNNTSNEDCKVCAVDSKRRSHQHWKVDTIYAPDIPIQHGGDTDQEMSNEYCDYGQAGA